MSLYLVLFRVMSEIIYVMESCGDSYQPITCQKYLSSHPTPTSTFLLHIFPNHPYSLASFFIISTFSFFSSITHSQPFPIFVAT